MRAGCFSIAFLWAVVSFSQQAPATDARPLVITDAVGLPLSAAQIFRAALERWPYSFGQEPGAKLMVADSASGSIQGVARFNFRSTGVGSREESMGAISYEVAIQAENGQCRVRICHFSHAGNHSAPGGGIDLGTLYAGERPQLKVPGVSMGSANRLHTDMRAQVQARLSVVVKNFFSALRRSAE